MSGFEGHTPGPWLLIWYGNERYPFPLSVHAEDGGSWVARDGTTSSAANARLIAAAPTLLRERDEARAALDDLRRACSVSNDDICQTLGKALGYPWFKDDQTIFPGATEDNGVCVGDHVDESIAAEAAKKIAELREAASIAREVMMEAERERDEARAEAERLAGHVRALLDLHMAHHNHPAHVAARAALNRGEQP